MTNRLTPNAKTLLTAALAASALMGLSACGSSSAKPSAPAAAAAASPTAVSTPASAPSAPSATQPSPVGTPSQPGVPSTTGLPASDITEDPTATQTQAPALASSPATSVPKPTSPTTASGLPGACTPDHLKGTVTALTRPINHVLLTVTNTGSATCSLYYYPGLRLDADQQAVTPAVEDSKPQAVVTIAPGASGYAAIGTSAADGSGGTPTLEKQVEVFLESRDQSGSLPGSLNLPLPAGTYVDSKAFVTYWEPDLQSAASW